MPQQLRLTFSVNFTSSMLDLVSITGSSSNRYLIFSPYLLSITFTSSMLDLASTISGSSSNQSEQSKMDFHHHLTSTTTTPITGALNPRHISYQFSFHTYRGNVGRPVQNRADTNKGFAVKQVKVVSKQRPKTLDSLFSNMKEQRMKVLSHQQNNNTRRNRGIGRT